MKTAGLRVSQQIGCSQLIVVRKICQRFFGFICTKVIATLLLRSRSKSCHTTSTRVLWYHCIQG